MSNDDRRSELNLNAYWPSPWRLQVERAERAEAENARLRALVSWIDGALVDEMPWLEIRAAINRYWQEQKP